MIGKVPGWAATGRVLLRGGNVYSPADPFATAMLIVGHEVGWIGGDGAALAIADGVDEVVELGGALVTPGFVDAHASDPAARPGVVLAQLFGRGGTHERPGVLLDAPEAVKVLAGDDDAAVASRIARQSRPLVVCAEEQDGARVAVRALERQAHLSGVRLDLTGGLPLDLITPIAGLGIVLVVLPGIADPPLAALAAAGVPLAFGSFGGPHGPWGSVREAVNHPDPAQRISARAAFAAATRGGWRAAGVPSAGTLVPGAPAHYAIWEVGDLVVQAPDERIQAWSTDPRSGTPGLPDLSPDAAVPRCRRTVVWGRTI